MTEGTDRTDGSAERAEAGEPGAGEPGAGEPGAADEPGADEPGPLSLAVGYATAGRDALARHEESLAIAAYERALPLAEAAVAAGDGPHEDLVRFLVYVHDVLGGLMLGRSELDRAEQHYTTALRLSAARDAGEADVVKFTNNLGAVARQRGDLPAALRLYQIATKLAAEVEPESNAFATGLSNTGTILLAMGDLAGALDLFRRALAIDERSDPTDAATDLSLIGSVLVEYGDLDQARDHYERALQVHRALDPRSAETARDLVNIGYCHRLGGDLDQALEYYFAARDVDRALGPSSLQTSADLSNISYVYEVRGNIARARHYLEQAMQISRTVAPRSQRTAAQLTNLAGIYVRSGQFAQARAVLLEALDIDSTVAPGSLETARDLNNLAAVAIDLGELAQAEDYARRALQIYRAQVPDSSSIAVVHSTLAAIAHARGDRDTALEQTRLALQIDRRRVPGAEPTVTDLINLAFLHRQRGELGAAIARYDEAVQIVESLRRRAGLTEAREEYFALLQKPYRGLVHALLRRAADGDGQLAFAVAERARGRALADLLAQRRLDIRPDNDLQRSLLADEQRLADELAAINGRIAASLPAQPTDRGGLLPHPVTMTAPSDSDLTHRHTAGEELERLRTRIRSQFPAYAQLRDPEPLGLAAAQAMLPADTLLLCYHVSDDGCAIWAVRRTDWHVADLATGLPALARDIDTALTPCRAAQPETPDAAAAWHRLGELLLGPVPSGWLAAAARVVIVGDGPLLHLPFDLLPFGDRPLADTLVVCYAPSVTVLGDLTERAASARETPPDRVFLGFGLADPDGDRSWNPVPLPGTREVSDIAADYGLGAKAITGADATKQRIFQETAGYRAVHFATHGILDDQDPLYSGLHVAPASSPPPGDSPGPEVLHVYEMFALQLTGAVVICSACETARGTIRAGEGLVGMSRALFYAGAISLVISLWPVPDAPTRRLMRVFHGYLRSGHDPALALSLAKRAVRSSHRRVYQHPYTWAGFIVLGATGQPVSPVSH
jgi:tetratricopeptide (TPR) repeat protein